ncbi:hypothetical protein [Hyphomicrobium sp.]|uniref:hypothetical protein n=1 Tax=Hyphomicrobium sp. TaxID=82 RepID=UPI0025B94E2D|nr:hypothetical protein [Hyphomicrobium sp.]MCC7253087.1 hypothetical protein [Hyphomicrobium sp.]
MSTETLNKSLVKAADAAGYAMASREEDLTEWTLLQPEVALRNGHVEAATPARRMSLPFARFEHWIAHMLSLSDIRVHTPRALLPSR